jgi:hypothetical protein
MQGGENETQFANKEGILCGFLADNRGEVRALLERADSLLSVE